MSDGLDAAVLKAGIDLLRLDVQLSVQDGEVANLTPRPYVLVYGYISRPENADSDALDGLSRTLIARWICHCVGESRESATLVSEHVRTQLLDAQITLGAFPNARFTLVKEESAQQPQPDKSTGVLVQDAICIYKSRVTI